MTKKIQHFLGTLLTGILCMSMMSATVFGKGAISFIGSAAHDKNEKMYRWLDNANRVHYSDQRPFYDISIHRLRILNVADTQIRSDGAASTETSPSATRQKEHIVTTGDTR